MTLSVFWVYLFIFFAVFSLSNVTTTDAQGHFPQIVGTLHEEPILLYLELWIESISSLTYGTLKTKIH